ncbi:MAG: ShlB/FhaC/HecB family hemolysin secretion/activation protein [Massilia sp.]|nr:ShlB/FhaC/HecB family hemolysin secretion/activation protein [Massilia sp.]
MAVFTDRPHRAALLLQLSLLALAGGSAQARQVDAGRALREASPPPPQVLPSPKLPALPVGPPDTAAAPAAAVRPGQAGFVLRKVRFNGNTAFDDATLAALLAERIGQRVTLDDLRAMAERITDHYRASRYVLTQTVVPQQDVSNGEVELSVLEGRFARLRIERLDDVRVDDKVVEAIGATLPRARPLSDRELERTVLLLSDLPGMATQASLEAGEAAGTYDLVVELKAVPRYNFSVDVDNQGTPSTGEYRAGALLRVNSPLGLGDNLDVRLLNSFGKGLNFGRLSYELPVGGNGLRTSLAYAHVQYELGRQFAELDANGAADVLELAATYPLLRGRTRNLFAKAALEAKRLRDDIDAVAQSARKQVVTANAGLVWEQRDSRYGGGFTSVAVTAYAGQLDIRSASERAVDQGPGGRRTGGRFVRASYQLSRLQAVSGNFNVYGALAGQWANRNLDSADKIAVGGPRSVRAFSGATGIGDEAAIATAEGRWSVGADTSLSLFYDLGRVRFNHAPLPGEANTRILSGYGAGLYAALMPALSLRASVAWPRRDSAAPAGGERSPRAYAQLVKTFN